MAQKQKRFMRMEINIALANNGYYMPRSLGSRSISVGRQAVRETKNFAILQLQFSEF